MSAYVLREKASRDLADIWRYTARRWDRLQADKYYRQLVNMIERLAENPSLGRPCDDVRLGYRRRNVGSHVVFYRTEDKFIEVVRILHARRYFARHLPDDQP